MWQGLAFLQDLKQKGRGYTSINSARSALSTILRHSGLAFGIHPDVKVFMKGVYNLNPPVARYVKIWDTSVFVNMLKNWSPAATLPLAKLTRKLAVLVLLVTGQRPQILLALRTNSMEVSPTHFEFVVQAKDLKQGRLGYKPDPVRLKKYAPDKRLCVYHYMETYLRRTLHRRGKSKQLFITFRKPYAPASLNTMSRWVKEVLQEAGVDTGVYKPGSTRHAATSKAFAGGLPLGDIMKQAGWSNSSVFAKYYNKPISKPAREIGEVVLNV